MRILCYVLCMVVIVSCQINPNYCQCVDANKFDGKISVSENINRYSTYLKCWKIDVPHDHFIRFKVQNFKFNSQACSNNYLRISINETNENYTFCESDVNKNPVTALNDVSIEVKFKNDYSHTMSASFTVTYEILELECAFKNSFHCTNQTCIPKSQVCDGVENCENGADEVGCETGVVGVPGVKEARLEAIAWLMSKRTLSWGWRENTARAVTALFLANAVNFNGTNLEEELIAKQTELKTAAALLKNPILNEELSSFINALLVTCHNPRHFYGQDLVKRLKSQVKSSGFTHPIAYLALCNANETWPDTAVEDLLNIFNSDSDYLFVLDIQAFAVMAVSCYTNTTNFFHQNHKNMTLIDEYEYILKRFKKLQLPDGSFGNIHTTSLVTQALLSGGQEHAKDWKLNETIKYLIKELNSSKTEVYGNYLTLPVFNGKSLSDIAKVNCTANPRKHGDEDLVSIVNDYTGPKMRVQYSLFLGDEKDVVHTISLRVPENFTAYEVMQLAEEKDQKYRFEWKRVSNKMYVYSIGKTTNDPEGGKFWLLYMGSMNFTSTLQHYTTSPDDIILEDNAHFVMWYKKAAV